MINSQDLSNAFTRSVAIIKKVLRVSMFQVIAGRPLASGCFSSIFTRPIMWADRVVPPACGEG